ncbi:hypothetical protein Hamer_G003631 [Homarus americanus]|uniref:Uncharacterized protein n=1 Tax=Homarus americanus TaxID=6706 RepID=A0A8J5JUK5_HOMAM|nr:hypothetical protein Hamer_G003631 [Homarus americanus]
MYIVNVQYCTCFDLSLRSHFVRRDRITLPSFLPLNVKVNWIWNGSCDDNILLPTLIKEDCSIHVCMFILGSKNPSAFFCFRVLYLHSMCLLLEYGMRMKDILIFKLN